MPNENVTNHIRKVLPSIMRLKEVAQNTVLAFVSQGFSFLLSVLTSLLVPKVLGVEEFGYWQLFLFYSSYTGFFAFGIADGIYLIEGGKSRNAIDKRRVNSALLFGIAYEVPLAVAVAVGCSLAGFEEQREFVILATAVYMVISYLWNALGYVFQAMNETKLYSFAVMANKLAFLLPLVFLLFARCDSFKPFVLFYIASHCCSLIYCVWNGRDILASGLYMPLKSVRIGICYIRVGIKLMFANIASMLILGFARLLIDAVWGIETFGKLSFSLSMVNFFLAFVSQASMVLFPALRQSHGDERRKVFSTMRESLTILLPGIYVFCFPLTWLIGMWLPQYVDSLRYFVFLLPMCVFDGKMDLLGTTFFKVLRKESTLLRINIATAVVSAIGTLLGVFCFENVDVVIFSVVFALAMRSLISEALISRDIDAPRSFLPLGEIIVTAGFLLTGFFLPGFYATCVYLAIYIVYLFVFKNETKGVVRTIKKMRGGLM